MKLRDFLKEVDENDIFLGRFVVIGISSYEEKYDSEKDSKKLLDKYLDCEVTKLRSKIKESTMFDNIACSAVAIYINDYEENKEEQK